MAPNLTAIQSLENSIMSRHLHHGLLLAALAFGPHASAELFDIVHIGDVHVGVGDRGIDHMTTWVKNNQVSKNIKLMSQTGDMVNTGTNDSYFNTAASSFLAPMITLADKMAIGISTGNHDYASYVGSVPQSHTDANRWIAKFGDATWLPYQSTWYLGKNPADDSHVQTFTAGGYTFLNISLEWFHSNSSNVWLKSILDANPTKPTIISTHSYLVPWVGDLRRVSPEGDSVWAIIKNYPQVFLVLSGHVWATTVDGSVATRTVTNTKGGQVMETVCDFQNCSASRGWVRLFNIDTVSTTGNIKVTTIPTDTGTPNTTDDFTGSLDFVSRFGPPNDGGDDTTPPAAPGALAGTTTPNSALLTWQAAVDPAPSSGIKGYDVDRGAAGSTVFVSGTSLDVTGLAASTAYTFRVQAIDTAGNRSEWSSVQVTTQEAGLSAFVMGINLNGNAVTIEGNAWRSYATALSNGLTVSPTPLTAATALTPSPAADTDTKAMLNSAIYSAGNWTLSQTLTNGTYDVYFWVMENYQANYRSFNLQLEGATVATGIGSLAKSAWAKYGPYRTLVSDGQLNMGVVKVTGDPHLMGVAIFSVTLDTEKPSVPANAVATAQSPTTIALTWDASSDNMAVTAYDIYRDGFLAGHSTSNSFSDEDLAASTFYTYTVKARDAAGNTSDASADASATTQAPPFDTVAPTVPDPVQASAQSSTSILVTWEASDDNVGVASYDIYRNGNGSPVGSSPTASFTDTGLTPSTLYTYTIKARDAAGNASDSSAEASATTQAAAVVLVEESFDYAAGFAINGHNGGTGWSRAWSNNQTTYALTCTDSMAAITGVNEIGGALQLLGDGNNVPQSTNRSFTPAISDTAGTTYWLAFEIQSTIVLKGTQDFWLRTGSTNNYKLLTLNTAAGSFTSFATTWTQTGVQLMLFKLVMNGPGVNEAVTLYVNPDLSTNSATWTAKATGSLAMDSGFDGFDLYSNTSSIATWAGPFRIDELRLATTWQGAVGQSALTPVENWRKEKFGDEHDEGNAADDQDPNHNGIKNLMEYALGGDPLGHSTGTTILPQAERDSSDKLQIRFNRYTDRSDLTLTVQASDSLDGPWEDVAVSTAGAGFVPKVAAAAAESGTGTTRSVTVTDFYPIGDPAHPKRFMRLKAEK